MSAARKRKKTKKPVRFEVSRLTLTGWCFGLFLALFWMFLLGLFVGKGITPANINFTEIKKRPGILRKASKKERGTAAKTGRCQDTT
jgi:hypothetical protein